MGLKSKPSNAWNLQSNAILECIHQVLRDCLVIFDLENTPIDSDNQDSFDEYLSSVACAIRSLYHQSHGHSPAQLVFGRDMFSPVETEVDSEAIRNNKQTKINKNNIRENSSRVPHNYQKGELITLKKPGIPQKLAIPRKGPYKVVEHNNNGSILIEKSPTDIKHVNVGRVTPYYCKLDTPIITNNS
jgi:hypothetical protein